MVECSPATRAARVRFPADAIFYFFFPFPDFIMSQASEENNHEKTEVKPHNEDDFTKCLKKMSAAKRPKIIRPSVVQAKLQQKKTHNKTEFYLTGGRKINFSVLKELKMQTHAPFRMPTEIDDIDFIERFNDDEREMKVKNRLESYINAHNYNSRLSQFKLERIHVPEITKLPGKLKNK